MTPISFRWLGVSGIEIEIGGKILLVDPYLTRIPVWKTFFGRIGSDTSATEKMGSYDYILITHSHFDHLLDTPSLTPRNGAIIAGSPNTKALLVSLGVRENSIKTVKPGDDLASGPFRIKVFASEHAAVPGYNPGELSGMLHPPLKARDYRMDFGCAYCISAGGISFLTDPGVHPKVDVRTDVLFTQSHHDKGYYKKLIGMTSPKIIVPVHWDNLFSQRDPRPYFSPPGLRWPPLRRIDLEAFSNSIRSISTSIKVIIPELFRRYTIVVSKNGRSPDFNNFTLNI